MSIFKINQHWHDLKDVNDPLLLRNLLVSKIRMILYETNNNEVARAEGIRDLIIPCSECKFVMPMLATVLEEFKLIRIIRT